MWIEYKFILYSYVGTIAAFFTGSLVVMIDEKLKRNRRIREAKKDPRRPHQAPIQPKRNTDYMPGPSVYRDYGEQ